MNFDKRLVIGVGDVPNKDLLVADLDCGIGQLPIPWASR